MFKIESYITPILLSYVDKYVKDFKHNDAQVSLWGGGVALYNLVLKTDVLQHEFPPLPFTLVSGRINELLIKVPWTKIMSEPIVVTIDTIECILSHRTSEEEPPAEPQHRTQVVEAPPGYMQALVKRVVSNISLNIQHLILKYVKDDIVLSLNVNHLSIKSAGTDWESAFAEIDQNEPILRRLITVDDLTLCLDKADPDGKIRFYQEPLLCRCKLKFRLLTRLLSPTTRRALSHYIQLTSESLEFSISNDQIILLLRLVRERSELEYSRLDQATNKPTTSSAAPLDVGASSSVDANVDESWSEWAWSWLPSWLEKDLDVEEAKLPTTPCIIRFVMCLDAVSLVFKKMVTDLSGKKRPRGEMALIATYVAAKGSICAPTHYKMSIGAKTLALKSVNNICSCGACEKHLKTSGTTYLSKYPNNNDANDFQWPVIDIESTKIVTTSGIEMNEKTILTDEEPHSTGTNIPTQNNHNINTEEHSEIDDKAIDKMFWSKISPLIFFDFTHERTPPSNIPNPYECPPKNFQYSDWIESCVLNVHFGPMQLLVSTGLLHRLDYITKIFTEQSIPVQVLNKRVLTVEECEALLENRPQRRINFECHNMLLRLQPCDHILAVPSVSPPPVYLDFLASRISIDITAPLYPLRVCSAASQLPEDDGPLWHAAHLHMFLNFESIQTSLVDPTNNVPPKPVAHMEMTVILHKLLCPEYFNEKAVKFNFSLIIDKLNIGGSAPCLLATAHTISSILSNKVLCIRSSVFYDAFHDDDDVQIDFALKDIIARGFFTDTTTTFIFSIQIIKAKILDSPRKANGAQAWILSAPDGLMTSQFLRISAQFCKMVQDDYGFMNKIEEGIEYIGIWIEPLDVCIDPLLLSWLSYESTIDISANSNLVEAGSSLNSVSRKNTPPHSSSGHTSKPGSSSEYVHSVRPRSQGSSNEPSERKAFKPRSQPLPDNDSPWWEGYKLVHLHDRLRYLLLNVECGVITVYVPTTTVSALDCATLHDAIERHVENGQPVTALCLGRISMQCNTAMNQLWRDVRHDGPTVFNFDRLEEGVDCFPWKMDWTSLSCYTFDLEPKEKSKEKSKRRSQLRSSTTPIPKRVVEDIGNTITLSIITKSSPESSAPKHSKKQHVSPKTDDKTKYFASGFHFKPTTFKDFIRGPFKSNKDQSDEKKDPIVNEEQPSSGHLVYMGICIHIDTKWIVCKFNCEQVALLKSALHCVTHLLAGTKTFVKQLKFQTNSSNRAPHVHGTLAESRAESGDNDDDSELISIYVAPTGQPKLKTSIWCQWVSDSLKISFTDNDLDMLQLEMDDLIATVDLQSDYQQLKFKMSSMSIIELRRSNIDEDWALGPFYGRVITISEALDIHDECITCTITQANVGSLPASWKAELHSDLESKSMWEISATLVILDIIIRPTVLEQVLPLLRVLASKPTCSLPESTWSLANIHWPLCFIRANGFRLFLSTDEDSPSFDKCFMFFVYPISINPHPANPICRRTLVGCDMGQGQVGTGFEGRQYEFVFTGISLYITNLGQMIRLDYDNSMGGENPAVIWTHFSEVLTSDCLRNIFNSSPLVCIFAPPLYVDNGFRCGPALEVNLMEDLSIDINLSQLKLITTSLRRFIDILKTSNADMEVSTPKGTCLYFSYSYQKSLGESTDRSEDQKPDSEPQSLQSTCFTNTSSLNNMYAGDNVENCHPRNLLDNLEAFLTFGTIRLSLRAEDDEKNDLITNMRPREDVASTSQANEGESTEESRTEPLDESKKALSMSGGPPSPIQYDVPQNDVGIARLNLNLLTERQHSTVALINVIFYQPNLYHTRSQTQTQTQISLFNLGIEVLGADGMHEPVFSTMLGQRDSITEIPPALATMKITSPLIKTDIFSNAGNMRLNIERPVMINVNFAKIHRLKTIFDIISQCQEVDARVQESSFMSQCDNTSFIYNFWKNIVERHIGSIEINTSQICISGEDGLVGFDSGNVQVLLNSRPHKLSCKSLLNGFLISMGSPKEERHPLVHPQIIGIELECLWEAWRRAEEGLLAKYPTTQLRVDFNYMTVDLRSQDVISICRLVENVKQKMKQYGITLNVSQKNSPAFYAPKSPINTSSAFNFYHDDLRSGAFKINIGREVFPLPYQVIICDDTLTWCYPHPRAIIKVIAYPMPNQIHQIECALEGYSSTLEQWQLLTDFSIKVDDPNEIDLFVTSPDAMFTNTWRIRMKLKNENIDERLVFNFNSAKYTNVDTQRRHSIHHSKKENLNEIKISMEELLSTIMVDSYFSPETLPETSISCRMGSLMLHVHNSTPETFKLRKFLEGYYISKSMMKSHRVLSFELDNVLAYMQNSSQCGKYIFVDTTLSGSIVDSDTGTLNEIIKPSRVNLAASLWAQTVPRIRLRTKHLHLKLNVPRLKTLKFLIQDWSLKMKQLQSMSEYDFKKLDVRHPEFDNAVSAMDGKITIWVHNNTALDLRFGQILTDEELHLGVGVKVAYRWYCPNVEKKLRFRLASTPTHLQDTGSIDLTVGEQAVVLDDAKPFGDNVRLYAKVEKLGVVKNIVLTGRLHLANMLKVPLLYKLRNTCPTNNARQTLCSGKILPETVGLSILCGTEQTYVLKIKFRSDDDDDDGNWSGDIPLTECRKGNLPWLVKVPRGENNDVKYVSLWCRVVNSSSDGRLLASIWPMYSLRSYLPLDIDVHLLSTIEEDDFTGYVKSVPSRGYSSPLLMPGTTSTSHDLSFRYRDINTPVTQESVPLHYGVTDRSMFKDRVHVDDINKAITEIKQLVSVCEDKQIEWPYCIVSKHIYIDWKPSVIQPRADCSVSYNPVNICGGCSLEVELRPTIMFCNASPISITLRAFDASPLCRLESASVVAPSSIILERSFFMSVEVEHEIFVSQELEIYHDVVGLYDTPPKGKVAKDHPLKIALHCHNKVASLTIYYEVKEFINILSVTSTHVIINQLKYPILVSAVVVPTSEERPVNLEPRSFISVPQNHGKIEEWSGVALCEFMIHGRWRGGELSELEKFLCIALPDHENTPAHASVPIKIEDKDIRRSVALKSDDNKSVPVVITQQLYEGRCIITIAEDSSPQFVIHNKTQNTIAVAKPITEASSDYDIIGDCPGVNWYSSIAPGTWAHYSTPDYSTKYPPIVKVSDSAPLRKEELTFAIIKDQTPKWRAPVETYEGEQLLQLPGEESFKMKTFNYPHSKLIVLMNKEAKDRLARDIRQRLSSPIQNSELVDMENEMPPISPINCSASTSSSCLESAESLPRCYYDSSSETTRVDWLNGEIIRVTIDGLTMELAELPESNPLVVVHLDYISANYKKTSEDSYIDLRIMDAQVDNKQHENGQYDFAVVATTIKNNHSQVIQAWKPLWSLFVNDSGFHNNRQELSKISILAKFEHWQIFDHFYSELTELNISCSPLELCIEDTYIASLLDLYRLIVPETTDNEINMNAEIMRVPIRLSAFSINEVDLILTLHTSARMYIALGQCPVRLGSFRLTNLMTSPERFLHALTVHYLSAAVLSAGWVLSGLELLGAPGAIAARISNASSGGVRSVATSTAAALVWSISSWASSLARNLDLLAGDEEHAMRAAAIRRHPPDNLVAALRTGFSNFAINILGAVGGIAHHPFVGVAVGENHSRVAGLRRGLIGAVTKPLSAVADLLALAGQGILRQAGWDPLPRPRNLPESSGRSSGWARDCVRWCFRSDTTALAGFEAIYNDTNVHILLTHEHMILIDPQTEKILEIIEFESCTLTDIGPPLQLTINQERMARIVIRNDDDEDYQISGYAMERVARYLGAEEGAVRDFRSLSLHPTSKELHYAYALLITLIHHNHENHFKFL